ncbi:hypothetical protein E7V67_022135 [[Empedobacter] haloabium]|uniref:YfhO family protein n=1 Tax=[Empedobacter] haloabium TaxID=592317 RepID=A0ABZ1UJD8_9BURK
MSTTFNISRSRMERLLPWVLALNLALLLFFLVFDYQVILHSDSAVKNLLAQEIRETGEYFPSEWNYANGDLWVLFTHTFVLLFLPFLRNGIGLHILSDVVTAALILAGGWAFMSLLQVTRAARIAGLCVLTGGISVLMAEHVFGQAAYGSMFYAGAFLLYCYWQQLHAPRRYWWWTLGTVLLCAQLFWANPLRAIIFYALPLLAAAAALRLARPAGVDLRPHVRTALLFLLSAALGTALHLATMSTVRNLPAPALAWLDFDGVLHNLKVTAYGLLILFDGMPRWDAAVASPMGAYRALRFVAALSLLYLMPLTVYRMTATGHPGRMFVAVFAAIAGALNLLLLLTTSLADMASPDGAIRYLVPSLLCMLLLLTVAAVDGLHCTPRERAVGLALVAVLATSSFVSYTFPYRQFYQVPPALKLPTQAARLAAFLQQNQLRYGYSSFWNAGKLTVLSAQAVRVRQVLFERGLPMPMRKLSSNRWYDASYHHGETFLLLQESELKQVDLPALSARIGAPVRTLRFEDWHVIVFNRNLAEMAEWNRTLARPAHYPASGETPHLVGTLQGDSLVAAPGESGVLTYGPGRMLMSGRYQVTFEVERAGTADDFGYVDVTADAGTRVLARGELSEAGGKPVVLTFATPVELSGVEFRVIASGKGRVAMRGAHIVRLPQQ